MTRKNSLSLVFVAIVVVMIAMPMHVTYAADNSTESLRTSRIVAQINEQQLVTLGGHVVPWATSGNDTGVAPDGMTLDGMLLMLKRSDAQEAALRTLLAEQQNSKSANYHKWLTPAEFGARFGLSDSDLAKVTAWLTVHGFTVGEVSKAGNVIRFSGTNAQLFAAFHTRMHLYKVAGEIHYANASNPSIPAALAPVIAGFASLNDKEPKPLHTTPQLVTRKIGSKLWQPVNSGESPTNLEKGIHAQFEGTLGSAEYHLLGPSDFATIYNVLPLWGAGYDGTGQTIAIVSPTDINPKDVDTFRATFGLPATKLNIIYTGTNPGIRSSYEDEADLDVEWAGAVAKNATIDLVVGSSSSATSGLILAMEYIVDNNLSPIMSISYGECELALESSGNAFIAELYKQAASQGITVLVAAGDAGSAACDQGEIYASYGLDVSGYASTPYNVAVGGTDFSVNFSSASTYWSSSSADTTLLSAKSYIPETPWNNSCASPEVLAAAQTYTDWSADTTPELLCNDSTAQADFLDVVGGGGGVSNCTSTTSTDVTECSGGYAQPSWQSGVLGVPSDSLRHLPDVSLFSGSGMWESAYVYCESDRTPDGACNVNNTDLEYMVAGGTSFATPALAGIVSIINQKSGSQQGNINYTLYNLAATQFNDTDKLAACKSNVANTTSNSCTFYDITDGSNAEPCLAGSADAPPNGVCTVSNSSDSYGILSGYSSGTGYDMATGLGSINAYNLLSNWPGSLASTTTALNLTTGSTLAYGVPLGGTVTVTPASGAGTPTGTITLLYKNAAGTSYGTESSADLTNGSGTVTTDTMPVGSYSLYARYAGDATYSASASSTTAVTISQAATSVALTSNRTTVAENESAHLVATVKSSSLGENPTGTIVFTNTTTGATVGTVGVSAITDATTGYSYSQAILSLGGTGLVQGSNIITATYSGDTNYTGSTGATSSINYTGGFSMTVSSSSLTLSPGATSGNTVGITLTPSAGTTLSASSVAFSCPSTLPNGVTCSFSTPVANGSGGVTSTLTIGLSSPLAQVIPMRMNSRHSGFCVDLAIMAFGGVFLVAFRKKYAGIVMCLILVPLLAFNIGCGGGGNRKTGPQTTITVLQSSSSTPALNSAVTLKAMTFSSEATGTVSFFDGTTLLGSAVLKKGTASLTTSSLAIGTRTLTATYAGDANYAASTSAAISVDVTLTTAITAQALDVTTGNLGQQNISLTVK